MTLHPLAYQSSDIPFSEWIALLTLSLSPLAMHIIAGTPIPSIIGETRPAWHDRICLYNPTSILWRYGAMTDFRIRAQAWSPITMAATNAIFWTDEGWDGSESMLAMSTSLCIRGPEHARVRLLSAEMLKTIVTALQGVQAFYIYFEGFLKNFGFQRQAIAVDNIFVVIAFFGLLRLYAAAWLTDDYDFSSCSPGKRHEISNLDNHANKDVRVSIDSLLISTLSQCDKDTRSHPFLYLEKSWGSRAFRVSYIIPLLSIWGFTAYGALKLISSPAESMETSQTVFLLILMYLQIATVTVILLGYHFIRGQIPSTVIPCASTVYYKLYTLWIFGWAIALLVVACIETRKTICGKYTSHSGDNVDQVTCNIGTDLQIIPVGQSTITPATLSFGIATTANSSGKAFDLEEAIWVRNFTGSCIGKLDTDMNISFTRSG